MSPKEFIRASQVPIVSDLIVVIATRSVGQENTHNNLSWSQALCSSAQSLGKMCTDKEAQPLSSPYQSPA